MVQQNSSFRPWWERWLVYAGINPDPTDEDMAGVFGDPAAVPVLLELLRRPELELRVYASYGLGAVGRKFPGAADAAIPSLADAFRDGSHDVRREARAALQSIDPESAKRADEDEGVPGEDDVSDRP
jgi:HEAT repeat protein